MEYERVKSFPVMKQLQFAKNSIQLSPEGEVYSGGVIYRDAKSRGIYLALSTDPAGDSCFSIYQISWIKMKKGNLL